MQELALWKRIWRSFSVLTHKKYSVKGNRSNRHKETSEALIKWASEVFCLLFEFALWKRIWRSFSVLTHKKYSVKGNRSNRHKETSEALIKWASEVFCLLFEFAKFYLFYSSYTLSQLQNSSFPNCLVWIFYDFIKSYCRFIVTSS